MRRDETTLVPFTRPAQAATIFAAESSDAGAVDDFHHRAYAAYWERSENLGNPAVLARLMTESGLDWDEFKPRLESGHYDARMQSDHDEAMMIGLTGVPSFVIGGKYGIVGAQPIETLVEVIERVISERDGERANG